MDIQLARHGFDDRIRWDPALIRKYDVPGPRYTSYPTALQFTDSFGAREYEQYLLERPQVIGPLSLYVHIPYCRNICYYCACNKIVTRDAAVAERYIVALEKETALLSRHFDRRRRVTHGKTTP